MIASELYDTTAGMSPKDRRATIAHIARDLDAGSPDSVDAICHELETGDFDHRELAVCLARVVGCVPALIRALEDPELRIRSLSARALPSAPRATTAVLTAAYEHASAIERLALIRGIRQAGRQAAGEAVFRLALAMGRLSEARLLSGVLSATPPADIIDVLAADPSARRRISRAHPEAFLEWCSATVRVLSGAQRDEWWLDSLAALARIRPDLLERVREIARGYPPAAGWSSRHNALWIALAHADSEATLEVLLSAPLVEYRGPIFGRRAARRLVHNGSPAVLEALGTGDPGIHRLAEQLIRASDPARLRQLAALLDPKIVIARAGPLAPFLPRETLVTAARERIAAGQHLGEDPRPADLAMLPWAEAEPALRPLTANRDPEIRATGYRLLFAAATTKPAFIALLGALPRLRNEQEPVRLAALSALAQAPMRLLLEVDPARIESLRADALAAPDLSPAVRECFSRIALRVLLDTTGAARIPRFREMALTLLGDTYGTPFKDIWALPMSTLREFISRTLAAPLSQEKLEMLSLAAGRRLARAPELGAVLRRAPRGSDISGLDAIFTAELRWAPDRVDLVRELARLDPWPLSADEARPLLSHPASDVLTEEFYAARLADIEPDQPDLFAYIDRPWMPLMTSVGGWGATARSATARYLDSIIRDARHSEWDRGNALCALALIPGHGLTTLREFASVHSDLPEDIGLRDKALVALGSRGEERAGDDLIRAALDKDMNPSFGATRAVLPRARRLRPAALEKFLTSAGRISGITVSARKALLAACESAHPPSLVARMDTILGADPHPDVRATALTLQLRRLDTPDSWAPIREYLAAESGLIGEAHRVLPARIGAAAREALAVLIADFLSDPLRRGPALSLIPDWSGAPAVTDIVWELLGSRVEVPDPGTVVGRLLSVEHAALPAGHGAYQRALDRLLDDPDLLTPRVRNRIYALTDPHALAPERRIPDSAAAQIREVITLLSRSGIFATAAVRLGIMLLKRGTEPVDSLLPVIRLALDGRTSVAAGILAPEDIPSWISPRAAARIRDAAQILATGDAAETILAIGLNHTLLHADPADDLARTALFRCAAAPYPEAREYALDHLPGSDGALEPPAAAWERSV